MHYFPLLLPEQHHLLNVPMVLNGVRFSHPLLLTPALFVANSGH